MSVQRRPKGTIPANTGKMFQDCERVIVVGDHPREYGENTIDDGALHGVAGPSPRIRGKSELRRDWDANNRTIPANTGKI